MPKPRRRFFACSTLATMAILLTGCPGGTPSGDATAPPTAPTTPATEPPAPVALEASPVVGTLNTDYRVDARGNPSQPSEDEVPVAPGDVEAHWYVGDAVWVALFGGLSLDDTGPLCPGTSLQVPGGFDHVTNSPTESGDPCEDHPDIVLAGDGAGVRICDDLVLYVSEIPVGAEGTLFASVERYEDDGTITGVTGSVAADAEAAPGIDLGASGYELPPELGGDTVTC